MTSNRPNIRDAEHGHDGWPTNIRGKGDDMDEWPKKFRIRQVPSRKSGY
jgi:hypothetical protein